MKSENITKIIIDALAVRHCQIIKIYIIRVLHASGVGLSVKSFAKKQKDITLKRSIHDFQFIKIEVYE